MSEFVYEIQNNPEQKEAGIIRVNVCLNGDDEENLTFKTSFLVENFLEDHIEDCQSKQDLNNFLFEARIHEDDRNDAITKLLVYVNDIITSSEYSPEYTLEVWIDLLPDDLDDSQIGDEVQESSEENNSIASRPASTLFVENLTRRRHNNDISNNNNQSCMICLEEFKEEEVVVTLQCGHEFDDECIVKWFETNHVCPLCRFEFPCED